VIMPTNVCHDFVQEQRGWLLQKIEFMKPQLSRPDSPFTTCTEDDVSHKGTYLYTIDAFMLP